MDDVKSIGGEGIPSLYMIKIKTFKMGGGDNLPIDGFWAPLCLLLPGKTPPISSKVLSLMLLKSPMLVVIDFQRTVV